MSSKVTLTAADYESGGNNTPRAASITGSGGPPKRTMLKNYQYLSEQKHSSALKIPRAGYQQLL